MLPQAWSKSRRSLRRSPLRDLTDLRVLAFKDNSQITSLVPLSGLTRLRKLDASFTGVSDLTPLIGLKHLRVLDLAGTSVEDLSPLLHLPSLEELVPPSLGVENTNSATIQKLRARKVHVN